MTELRKVQIWDNVSDETAYVTNNGLDVNIQDQHTKIFFSPISQAVTGPYTLNANTVADAYTIVVNDAADTLTAGDSILLVQDSTYPASYFGVIQSIAGSVTRTLTMDSPVDIIYATGTSALFEIISNMNVDGSATRSIFDITNGSSTSLDITRTILHITDGTDMDDSLFGGIAALTNGCVFRKKNAAGDYLNYGNFKTNGDIGFMCYDKEYDEKAPAGTFGLSARLTFGGQSKLGCVVRLEEDEKLELIIQDDLTDLTSFRIMAEGHFTDEI